jgi:outer membrane lipase/esterase
MLKAHLAAGVAVATLCAASVATAQDYSRVVVFGDSLSDNGNLYRLSRGANPPSPPYYQGRFSSGPVWVELLGFPNLQGFGAVNGNVDNAFGGARTDAQTTPPGLRAQYAAYTAAGGRFGPNDLAIFWGGANNLFQAFPVAVTQTDPLGFTNAAAVSAATDVATLARQAAGAGAGTVLVVNLPALGETPQFRGGPAQALANAATNTFNGALAAQLNGVASAAPGSNVILMDLTPALLVTANNPGAFGVTNSTQPCLNATTGAVCANPDSYFYFDGVHPTATGHRIVAALAQDYFNYGERGIAAATQVETGLLHRQMAFDGALERLDHAAADPSDGRVSFLIEAGTSNDDARGALGEAERDTISARFAADVTSWGDTRAGLTIDYARSEVSVGATRYEVTTFGGGLYGAWSGSGGLFVDGIVGAGLEEYDDIRRGTGIAAITHESDTRGFTAGAKARAGLRLPLGGGTLSPRAAVAYVHGVVDGYEESGASARHLVQGRDVDAFAAEASLRFDTTLTGGLGGWAEVGYRDYLSYDADPVRVGIAGNSARRLAYDVDAADGGGVLLNAGLKGSLGERWSIDAAYRGVFGDRQSNAGVLSLTMKY